MANLSPLWEPPAELHYNFSYSAASIVYYSVWIQLPRTQQLSTNLTHRTSAHRLDCQLLPPDTTSNA